MDSYSSSLRARICVSIQSDRNHGISSKSFLFIHIFRNYVDKLVVLVGTNSLNSGGTRYNLKKILVHEQYNKPALAYDISLIRVQGDIQFNAKVKSIELAKTQVPAGTELVATGWGLLSVIKMIF